VGVNADGKGVMAFTLVGDGFFPSASYAAFNTRTSADWIFVAKPGRQERRRVIGLAAHGQLRPYAGVARDAVQEPTRPMKPQSSTLST
jgi:hypothetical protein